MPFLTVEFNVCTACGAKSCPERVMSFFPAAYCSRPDLQVPLVTDVKPTEEECEEEPAELTCPRRGRCK